MTDRNLQPLERIMDEADFRMSALLAIRIHVAKSTRNDLASKDDEKRRWAEESIARDLWKHMAANWTIIARSASHPKAPPPHAGQTRPDD